MMKPKRTEDQSRMITLRISQKEYDIIAHSANCLGMSLNGYVRFAIFQKEPYKGKRRGRKPGNPENRKCRTQE